MNAWPSLIPFKIYIPLGTMRFTFHFSFALGLYAVIQSASLAQAPSEGELSPALVERVTAFLQEFIDPEKSPHEQAALFAQGAEYYEQGQVPSKTIMQDVKRYASRWPSRNYRLSAIHYIKPDPDSDRVFVSYEIDYQVANRSKTVNGKAYYGAVITDLMNMPKIEWIKEQVQPGRSVQ